MRCGPVAHWHCAACRPERGPPARSWAGQQKLGSANGGAPSSAFDAAWRGPSSPLKSGPNGHNLGKREPKHARNVTICPTPACTMPRYGAREGGAEGLNLLRFLRPYYFGGPGLLSTTPPHAWAAPRCPKACTPHLCMPCNPVAHWHCAACRPERGPPARSWAGQEKLGLANGGAPSSAFDAAWHGPSSPLKSGRNGHNLDKREPKHAQNAQNVTS